MGKYWVNQVVYFFFFRKRFLFLMYAKNFSTKERTGESDLLLTDSDSPLCFLESDSSLIVQPSL